MRYLVTGGNGFLGTHLVQQLLEHGHSVVLLCRSPVPLSDFQVLRSQLETIQGSILDFQLLQRALVGCDGVFHLAGVVAHTHNENVKREMYQANVEGTLAVIRCVAMIPTEHRPRIVYASTSGIVACSEHMELVEESEAALLGACGLPYYDSKLAAEVEAHTLSLQLSVEVVYMRPTLLLGPGDERLSSVLLVKSFLEGKVPFTPTGGFAYVDVRDTATAFITAMTKGSPGQTYLLGTKNVTVKEFFRELQRLSGVSPPLFSLPNAIIICSATLLNWMNIHIFRSYDPTVDPVLARMGTLFFCFNTHSLRARNELQWKTRPTDQTLKDTIDWLRQDQLELQRATSKNTAIVALLAVASVYFWWKIK